MVATKKKTLSKESTRPFVHLHGHSHYSLLDGASRLPELCAAVKGHGMNSVALTDHGNLYGAIDFYSECKSAGLNPVIGYEAYVAPNKRTDREAKKRGEAGFHLTILAQNNIGFKNLIKLSTIAYLEGFYYIPRIDKEVLEAHSEGLIVLSGCASSEFSDHILKEDFPAAEKLAAWFAKVFKKRFFVEVQNNGLDIQRECAQGAIRIADAMGLPLVATSDAHYLTKDDALAHDVLLCVNTGRKLDDPNRMRYGSDLFYIRPPEEMYDLFPGQDASVKRSQEIADTVDINLDFTKRHFPVYTAPVGVSAEDHLREMCAAGLKKRFGDNPSTTVTDRLNHELGIICRMGFASYFLIVGDFVRFAMDNGIPSSARGSACGALVSYVLELSHVDPLEYDLLFERFLDPNRSEAPDIDIDFCQNRREEVLAYVRQKYGEASVAQIGTFGTMAARAAIKDVGRALDVPLEKVNQLVSFIPKTLGITLPEALAESRDLKMAYDGDPEIKRLLDIAIKLEGTNRNTGTHAAGVVISDGPLVDYAPLQRVVRKGDDAGSGDAPITTTQWTMEDLEKVGLLKMDFLGLRTLTVLDNAVRIIRENRGIEIDLKKIPLDDKLTFALLQRGDAKGVFQLESDGIRELLKRLKPDNIRDIIAIMALYRPGPLEGGMVDSFVNRKHGTEKPHYAHPFMEEILSETHGVMVYQEQIMRILNRLGGIELSSAYACIKAISKKKHDIIDQRKGEFIQGGIERGLAREVAEEIFQLIVVFGGYGFNKSHSAAYAQIGYQTAWLKAHYLPEFMAALLTSEIDDANKRDILVDHIADSRRLGVEVIPPSVNLSQADFIVHKGKIIFGLLAIKGVGRQAALEIARARQEGGNFKDLFDLCERIDGRLVPKSALEKMVYAGAMDCFKGHRAQFFAALPRAVQAAQLKFKDQKAGQRGLFDLDDTETKAATEPLPTVDPWPDTIQLKNEKEVLDFYITSNPLSLYEKDLNNFTSTTIAMLIQKPPQESATIGGIVTMLKAANTKKARNGNSRFLRFRLEDMTGTIDCVIWPDDLARIKKEPKEDELWFATGDLERNRDQPAFMIRKIVDALHARRELAKGLFLRLDLTRNNASDIDRLGLILREAPGPLPVFLDIQDRMEKKVVVRLAKEWQVAPEKVSEVKLAELLGPANVRLG